MINFDEKFLKLISDYCETINKPTITFFELIIEKNNLNSIDMETILPDYLIGLNMGYNIYKLIINKKDFVSSDYGCSKNAKNVWYKLFCDNEMYILTNGKYIDDENSQGCSFAISKKVSDERLYDIITDIKNNIKNIYGYDFKDLILDNDLLQKI